MVKPSKDKEIKMEQRDIEKFRKHMGLGKTMKIKNQDGTEDEFYFKPLGCKFLPDFMKLATSMDYSGSQKRELSKMKQLVKEGKSQDKELNELYATYDGENSTKIFEGDNANLIIDLIEKMVILSYPELDKDVREVFVMNNFAKLQGVLMELNENLGKQEVDEKILKKIEQVKSARRNA